MKQEEIDYARHRVTRARETLQDAALILERGHLHSAVNRLYYACFYMVSTLLFLEGFSSAKHTGIRSLFDRHWIKTKRLPLRMSAFYRNILKHRQEADYGDRITFDRHDTEIWFKEAQEFFSEIAKHIEAKLKEEHEENRD